MSHSSAASPRQTAHLFASMRRAFTPLSHLHSPLHAGFVAPQAFAERGLAASNQEPIYLLQQSVWHTSAEGFGKSGVIDDAEMADLIDPFVAAQNLLSSARQNIDSLVRFLDRMMEQPQALHILERCLREPETRTVWMVRANANFPTEQEIDAVLDQVHGSAD